VSAREAHEIQLDWYHGQSSYPEVATTRRVLEMAQELIVLADHTKLGHTAAAYVAPITRLTPLVTDAGAEPEFVAQLEAKARAAGLAHVTTRQHDLVAAPLTALEFDLILSAMTLHHVRDVSLLLRRFRDLLASGGLLAIADLDAEDGSFHQDPRGVEHHGFCREWVAEQLQAAGFSAPVFETVHEIKRPDATGELRCYPVFLATAKKNDRRE
jgi:SAM-dependent methyltransferase